MSFIRDLRVAFYSFWRTRGMALTVILTLALGIGANAAIFTLVRGVLLKPLVNRDEDRLIYIRQSAPGLKVENAAFSVPEIVDLRAGAKTLSEIGDFSTIGFTMVGLGEPREVRAGATTTARSSWPPRAALVAQRNAGRPRRPPAGTARSPLRSSRGGGGRARSRAEAGGGGS